MGEETEQRNHIYITLFLIIALAQMSVAFFYITQRENFFLDELLSFGYAHTFTFPKKDVSYINESSSWEYETWVQNQALKSQLVVSGSESLLAQPPQEALSLMLNRRNYFGILNILMSVFAPNRLSRYPGGVFNILLLFASVVLLFRIVREVTKSYPAALLAVGMYGFSTMAVEMTMFIRFYMLVTVLFLCTVRLHQIAWRTDELWKYELFIVASMMLWYFAMRNSELVLILAGGLIISFVLAQLASRQYRKVVWYLATTVPVGVGYAVMKTNYINIIMHPERYTGEYWPINVMTRSVLEMNPHAFLHQLHRCVSYFVADLFGSKFVLLGFTAIVLVLLGIWLHQRTKTSDEEQHEADDDLRSRFFWVVSGTVLVYLVFSVLTAFPASRYLSFLFPLVSVMLWSAISLLTRGEKVRTWVFVLCTALTVFGVFFQQVVHRNYSYVYAGDGEIARAVEECGVEDVVLVYADGFAPGNAIYDCVSQMPDYARIYPVDMDNHHIDADSCPDELLIWTLLDSEVDPYVEDLTSGGFQIEKLGSNHASDIYLARRTAGTKGDQ